MHDDAAAEGTPDDAPPPARRTGRPHPNPAPAGPRGQRGMTPREHARSGGAGRNAQGTPPGRATRAGATMPPPTPRPRGASDPAMAAKNARRAADRAAQRAARIAARKGPQVIEKSGGGTGDRGGHTVDTTFVDEAAGYVWDDVTPIYAATQQALTRPK